MKEWFCANYNDSTMNSEPTQRSCVEFQWNEKLVQLHVVLITSKINFSWSSFFDLTVFKIICHEVVLYEHCLILWKRWFLDFHDERFQCLKIQKQCY